MNMKTFKMFLAVMVSAVVCTQVAAQGFRRESFPEGSYSPVTNINRVGYPRVLKDLSIMFRVNAPQAQSVQIDLDGDHTSASAGIPLLFAPYRWRVGGRSCQSVVLRLQSLVECHRDC